MTWNSGPCESGTCVRVEFIEPEGVETHVEVWDTKDPNSDALVFTATEWRKFIADVKEGKYDL